MHLDINTANKSLLLFFFHLPTKSLVFHRIITLAYAYTDDLLLSLCFGLRNVKQVRFIQLSIITTSMMSTLIILACVLYSIHSLPKASMIFINPVAIKKLHHSMHMPSGSMKSGSFNNNKSTSGTVYKLHAAASRALAFTDDAKNKNCPEHALGATSIGIALCNDKGSSGGDANKKGEPNAVVRLISREEEEEVGYPSIAYFDCTYVFVLDSTIHQCFPYSFQQTNDDEILVKGKRVEVRRATHHHSATD